MTKKIDRNAKPVDPNEHLAKYYDGSQPGIDPAASAQYADFQERAIIPSLSAGRVRLAADIALVAAGMSPVVGKPLTGASGAARSPMRSMLPHVDFHLPGSVEARAAEDKWETESLLMHQHQTHAWAEYKKQHPDVFEGIEEEVVDHSIVTVRGD